MQSVTFYYYCVSYIYKSNICNVVGKASVSNNNEPVEDKQNSDVEKQNSDDENKNLDVESDDDMPLFQVCRNMSYCITVAILL